MASIIPRSDFGYSIIEGREILSHWSLKDIRILHKHLKDDHETGTKRMSKGCSRCVGLRNWGEANARGN